MTFVTIGARSVSVGQITAVRMTGEEQAAELIVTSSVGWLKMSGPHAVALHSKLLEVMRSNTLTDGMGVELDGPGDRAHA